MPFGPDGQFIQSGTVDVAHGYGFFVLSNENATTAHANEEEAMLQAAAEAASRSGVRPEGGYEWRRAARDDDGDLSLIRFSVGPLSFRGLQILPLAVTQCNGMLLDPAQSMLYIYGSDTLLGQQGSATVAELDAYNVTEHLEAHTSFQTLSVGRGFNSAFLDTTGNVFANTVSSLTYSSSLFLLNMTVAKGKEPEVLGQSELKAPPTAATIDSAYTYGMLSSAPPTAPAPPSRADTSSLVFLSRGTSTGLGVDIAGGDPPPQETPAAESVHSDAARPDEYEGTRDVANVSSSANEGAAPADDPIAAPYIGKFFSSYPWPSISSSLTASSNVSLYDACALGEYVVTLSALCSTTDGEEQCNEFVVQSFGPSGIGFAPNQSLFLIQLSHAPPSSKGAYRPPASLVCLNGEEEPPLVVATVVNYLFVANLASGKVSHLFLDDFAVVTAFRTHGSSGMVYASGTNYSRRSPPNSILQIDVSGR